MSKWPKNQWISLWSAWKGWRLLQIVLYLATPVDHNCHIRPHYRKGPSSDIEHSSRGYMLCHNIVGNFWERKLPCIGRKRAYRRENNHWMLNQSYRWVWHIQNFMENTSNHKIRESFLPWKFAIQYYLELLACTWLYIIVHHNGNCHEVGALLHLPYMYIHKYVCTCYMHEYSGNIIIMQPEHWTISLV